MSSSYRVHAARSIAAALNAEELFKIRSVIEFLQEVEQIANDLHVSDNW